MSTLNWPETAETTTISSTPPASPSTGEGYSPEQVSSLAEFLQRVEPPQWQSDARCVDLPQEIFFGKEQRDGLKRHRPTLTSVEVRRAKGFCAECPVAQECLEHALAFDERHGVWGGTTPREREVIQRKAHRLGNDTDVSE